MRIKTELTALGVLMLEKVTLSDAGVYTCLAESPEGQISSSVSLNVLCKYIVLQGNDGFFILMHTCFHWSFSFNFIHGCHISFLGFFNIYFQN